MQRKTPWDMLLLFGGGLCIAEGFQACGLDRRWLSSWAGSGRSYFLPRLLRELVFAEQQLAGLVLNGEMRRERLQRGLLATIAALSVTLLTAWAVSYRYNSRYVTQVDQAVAAAVAGDDGLGDLVDGGVNVIGADSFGRGHGGIETVGVGRGKVFLGRGARNR